MALGATVHHLEIVVRGERGCPPFDRGVYETLDLRVQSVHKIEGIAVWRLDSAFLDAIAAKMERKTKLELTRNDGQLYVGVGGATLEAPLERASLVPA